VPTDVATVMYPLIDVGKIGKRVRRECATQHGRPSEPYGSCPFPLRKGTFNGPVPISEGVCDGLAAPFLPPRATIPREKENGARQESENCLNIAACVDVRSLVLRERERESGNEGQRTSDDRTHGREAHATHHVKAKEMRRRTSPTDPPALCAPAYARGLTAPI
jgi:hypothetical protein